MEGVELERLRILLHACIHIQPEIELKIRDRVVGAELVPPQTVSVRRAVDVEVATSAVF